MKKLNKNKKIFIIIAIILILGAIAYFVWKKRKLSDDEALDQAQQSTEKPANTWEQISIKYGNTYDSLPKGSLPLSVGSPKSKMAWLLQLAMNKLHNSQLSVDGVYGNNTANAVIHNYQSKIVDRDLAMKIYNDIKGVSAENPTNSSSHETFVVLTSLFNNMFFI